MEPLIIINIVLTALLALGVVYLILKSKKSGESVDKTTDSSSINATIDASVKSINFQIEKLERQMSALKEENAKAQTEIVKTLGENLAKTIEFGAKNNEANIKHLSDGLESIRKQNNEKLEAIQKAVDEKLDATLTSRLKTSFDNVIKQISDVNTAVGEIKGLAKDVSSLNRVLTNVKTKGIVGEIALGNIIEQTLTPDQYETNKITKTGSSDPVEFAIKMPGSDDKSVYMPIDAKFPLEAYHAMKDASDALDKERYEASKKELKARIKKFAKDIRDKYIDPPNTTDFAIMFLPIEGLYVEALDMGLFEELQRDYKINIAGPSTLTALLNALQVGFKSLIIQKRSSQVFDLLGAVKHEFGKFADSLNKVQKKFGEASNEMENLVGTRTRMINSKLKSITALDEPSAEAILGTAEVEKEEIDPLWAIE